MNTITEYDADDLDLIQGILALHPSLTSIGYNVSTDHPKYDEYRLYLTTTPAEFYRAKYFLSKQTISTSKSWTSAQCINSYVLKHRMEKPDERDGNYDGYMANGTAILAALFLGIPIKEIPDDPNVFVKIMNTADVRKPWSG